MTHPEGSKVDVNRERAALIGAEAARRHWDRRKLRHDAARSVGLWATRCCDDMNVWLASHPDVREVLMFAAGVTVGVMAAKAREIG